MLRSELFTDDKVDLKVLKERALGMRWAGMPEGTIPLTSGLQARYRDTRGYDGLHQGRLFPLRP